MHRVSLELVVFLSGASVMILELVGSRILAPYVGTSIFVWTSLIGIILASLSVGYWWGGRLSDRAPRPGILALLLFFAGVWVGVLALISSPVLEALVSRIQDVRAGSVVATLILFAGPSILMGMVSPYAVRLKIDTVDSSGATVGRLYAISTLGSIVGTFLAGFVLIAYLSNPAILLVICAVLIGTSFLADPRRLFPVRAGLVIVLIALFWWRPPGKAHANVIDVNTLYSRVWIYDRDVPSDSGGLVPTRFMRIGNENSGAMFLDYWTLVYDYTKFFRLAHHFNPDGESTLLVGGGAYAYPTVFLHETDTATLDVVEIDPKVTELAEEYFFLDRNEPRLRILHEDGRTYLNRREKRYDAVLIDAYRSYYYVPPHLVTREAFQTMSDALNEDGVLLANLLCVMEGERSDLFRAVYHTLREVFPTVLVFPVMEPAGGEVSQNVMLVALKSEQPVSLESTDPKLGEYLGHLWEGEVPDPPLLLRDAFSPVDHYVLQALPTTSERVGSLMEVLGSARRPTPSVSGK